MRRRLALLGLILLAGSPQAIAQSDPLYIQFRPGAVKGALYKPDTGPAPHVAVLLTHRTSNFLSHIATRELPTRGFLVLAMNPRSDNNEAAVDFERNALDIKSGIEFLRKQPGVTQVVLFGHSGGGPATSFYQAVAENGPSYCQGPNKLVECLNDLAGLPRADGLVLMDAHPGISVNALRSINPAVVNEDDPLWIDPPLDPFNPANGYSPDDNSSYSDQFRHRYFIRDNEIHYEMAASKDKDYIVIEGAAHGGTPCTACETTPGEYSNTLKNLFDYVAQWIDARF